MDRTWAGSREAIREVVDRLPERTRLILALRYGEGLGVREVAEALDLTTGEARQAILRAVSEVHRVWSTRQPGMEA